MAIIYPDNRKQVSDRIATDVQNELPDLNPFLRESIIRALTIAIAGRLYDIYTQIDQAQNELSPITATLLDFIRRFGLLKGIDVNAAAAATGNITAAGTATTLIPENTIFQTTDGTQYEVINQDYEITTQIVIVASITRSGSTATATFSTAHQYAPGTQITIAGADQAEYNGTYTVLSVPTETSLTYQISGTPATPATGTITSTATLANVVIRSIETGLDKNLAAGAKASLASPIAGVDNDAYVQYGKISGGTDVETTEEYRARTKEAYAYPISNFSAYQIISVAKTTPGVTRVWVFEATPAPGDCQTYFVRDNDDYIIPDSTEIAQVREEILKIKSAPTREQDVYVLAPTPVSVDFVFTSLSPDSDALRTAIRNNLIQFFEESTDVGANVTSDAYRSAIYQTINPKTGEFVGSFSLSNPAGDVSIAAGELAVLGNITWNF